MVKKGGDGGLITKIADLVREKKITGISDLRDESDRSGMRLVIELKRGDDPEGRRSTSSTSTRRCRRASASTWSRSSTACRGRSACKELIQHYVGHQREVVIRRTQYELRQAEARAHILEGLLIALDNLDAVIALIRGSADPDAARAGLIERFELSDDAGPGDPRHAPAAPHRARVRQGPRRARRAHQDDRRAAGDPRRRGPDRRPDQRGARPRSPSATATSAAPRSPSPRATSTSRT